MILEDIGWAEYVKSFKLTLCTTLSVDARLLEMVNKHTSHCICNDKFSMILRLYIFSKYREAVFYEIK